MRRLGILALLAALWLTLGQGLLAAAERGPTLITVTGAVGKTNRPAFSKFADRFFAHHEITFEKAFVFDRASLAALPQLSIVANAEGWPAPVAASGPRLADVLAAAGVAPTAAVKLFALDGYGVELSAEDLKAQDWVLAISADGGALGIGGRGPAWLLFDSGGVALAEDVESQWVYSVFTITAE
jgi:hypothetical protein